MAVTLEKEAGGGVANGVEAGELGFPVIDDDAAKLLLGHAGNLWDGGALKVEHLSIGFEPGFELGVIDVLDGGALLNGVHGGGGGTLAEDHEDGLHADAAKGDVAGAEAGGGEEIRALCGAGAEAAEADGVRAGANLDIALIAHESLCGDVALDVVGIHVVGTHADAVFHDFAAFAVLFAHDVVANHAAGFAHIHLAGPIAVFGKFILGEAELLEGGADFFWNAGVIGEGPHEAFLPVFVGLPDLGAGGVVGVWVVPVLADEIGGDGEVVIGIGLAIGHPGGGPGDALVPGLAIAEDEFKPLRVIVGGLFPGAAVFWHVGGAHAEIVGLDFFVAGEFFAWTVWIDAGEEAAGGIAGLYIGIDLLVELMVDGAGGLDAIEGLSINAIGLASDVVGDACGG